MGRTELFSQVSVYIAIDIRQPVTLAPRNMNREGVNENRRPRATAGHTFLCEPMSFCRLWMFSCVLLSRLFESRGQV